MADTVIHGQMAQFAMPQFNETDANYYSSFATSSVAATPEVTATSVHLLLEKKQTHHKLKQYKEILLKLEKDKYMRDDKRRRLR